MSRRGHFASVTTPEHIKTQSIYTNFQRSIWNSTFSNEQIISFGHTSSTFKMPFLEPKVLSSLIHRANPPTSHKPVRIRGPSASQGSTIRSYGIGKYINGDSTTEPPEFPYSSSNLSRSRDSDSARPSLTDGGKGGSAAERQSGKAQDISEKARIEEEYRTYQAEVEKHNQEFEKGHDRGHEQSTEPKVDEKFWKGTLHQYSRSDDIGPEATNRKIGYKERPWKHKA